MVRAAYFSEKYTKQTPTARKKRSRTKQKSNTEKLKDRGHKFRRPVDVDPIDLVEFLADETRGETERGQHVAEVGDEDKEPEKIVNSLRLLQQTEITSFHVQTGRQKKVIQLGFFIERNVAGVFGRFELDADGRGIIRHAHHWTIC
jgi:hypothetical protein